MLPANLPALRGQVCNHLQRQLQWPLAACQRASVRVCGRAGARASEHARLCALCVAYKNGLLNWRFAAEAFAA